MSNKRLSPQSRQPRLRRSRRGRIEQYELFAAAWPPAPDARHYRRQAQLCRRLLGALHQAELVEMLGRLHDEYEQAASRIEGEKCIPESV
jgi:hypothetical protein